MERRYEIVLNENGRRILCVRGLVDIESEENLHGDDFDAIFCDVNELASVDALLSLMSPAKSNKCWIKPRFFKSLRSNDLKKREYVIDGYANSPYDNSVTTRIEEIFARIEQLGISLNDNLPSLFVMKHLRLCRYAFVRGWSDFTATTVPGLTAGYSALCMGLSDNLLLTEREDMFLFIQKLETLGYIRNRKFVEHIHVCPDCHLSHLLFLEICPQCKSSDIKEEAVIHHFRCANVSPESTYEYDGQLRCPKCRRFLRHIGVDYDRPAEVYSCRNCGNSFLHADMKVYCVNCRKTFKTDELQPYDVNEFEFTEEAVKTLSSPDGEMLLAKERWNGFSEFSLYKKQLQWFSYTSGDERDAAIVLRFDLQNAFGSRGERRDFLESLCSRFYYYNFAENGSWLYVSHHCMSDSLEEKGEEMGLAVCSYMGDVLGRGADICRQFDKQMFLYRKGEDVDLFLKKIITPTAAL